MVNYNEPDTDWIEYGLSLLLVFLSVVMGFILRYMSKKVLQIDAERTLISQRTQTDQLIVYGENKFFSLLGAPHTLITRSSLAFFTLVGVVVGTAALTITASSFSGSQILRKGEKTIKVTARAGSEIILNEDRIEKIADWFRSTGVVSFCQRRVGEKRTYYQPFVEQASTTRVYCGRDLDIDIAHEVAESIEQLAPTDLRILQVEGVEVSTPNSNYVVHDINIAGRGYNAVCNTGDFYRGLRTSGISQSCAFSTDEHLILGGYTVPGSLQSIAGPGITPNIEDIRYYDSYTVKTKTQLSEKQLMQALTLWDLGSMSEVEVAVLCRLSLVVEEDAIDSFIGGYERLHIDYPLLITGIASLSVILLVFVTIILWDGFTRTVQEGIEEDISSISFFSKKMRAEAQQRYINNITNIPENFIAIREVTHGGTDTEETKQDADSVARKRFYLGSSVVGNPVPTSVPLELVLSHINNTPENARDSELPSAGN